MLRGVSVIPLSCFTGWWGVKPIQFHHNTYHADIFLYLHWCMPPPPNPFCLEFKPPESIYVFPVVTTTVLQNLEQCLEQKRQFSGGLNEREKKWISKFLYKIQDSFIIWDCYDYPHHSNVRWLIVVPCLHGRIGLWLDLVSYPSFQLRILSSFRYNSLPPTPTHRKHRFVHRHMDIWD